MTDSPLPVVTLCVLSTNDSFKILCRKYWSTLLRLIHRPLSRKTVKPRNSPVVSSPAQASVPLLSLRRQRHLPLTARASWESSTSWASPIHAPVPRAIPAARSTTQMRWWTFNMHTPNSHVWKRVWTVWNGVKCDQKRPFFGRGNISFFSFSGKVAILVDVHTREASVMLLSLKMLCSLGSCVRHDVNFLSTTSILWTSR